MREFFDHFLNIKYEGERFSGGRLPLDVLADLQALEDILTTFAREIWLKENDRERMPNGYNNWFTISLKGVGDGSAVPQLELSVFEDSQQLLIPDQKRHALMGKAEKEFARVLKAASDGVEVAISATQIRNFNRFLTNLKTGEKFKYSSEQSPIFADSENVISLDVERRKRFLTSVTTTYQQRIQGRARLKGVDENGTLRFVNSEVREFTVIDDSRYAARYGANIGSYYEFDLTVERRHDDIIQSVVTIHDLSLLEHPAITAIDNMSGLTDGWLDGFGKAVSDQVREIAKDFILTARNLPTFYAIAPTEEGGILLEYDHGGWDYGIEFNSDCSFTLFGIELEGGAELLEQMPSNQLSVLQERVRETIEEK